MQTLNEDYFKESMIGLAIYFGREISTSTMTFYWKTIGQWDKQKFDAALNGLVCEFSPTSQKPFPLVCDFIQSVGEGADYSARRAILALKYATSKHGPTKSISFDDNAMHALISQYGGWIKFCADCIDAKFWDINEGRLVSQYKSLQAHGDIGPEHLAGTNETENSAAGFFQFIRPPIHIGYNQNGKLVSSKDLPFPMLENVRLDDYDKTLREIS